MKHAITSTSVFAPLVLFALYACDGVPKTDTSPLGIPVSNAAAGQLDLVGQLTVTPVAYKDVVSAVVTADGTQKLVVVVSDAAELCSAVTHGTAANGNLLLIHVNDGLAPGEHTLGTAASITVRTPGAADVEVPTGSVALSYVASDNSSPAVLVINAIDGNNRLAGSINAPFCPGLLHNASF